MESDQNSKGSDSVPPKTPGEPETSSDIEVENLDDQHPEIKLQDAWIIAGTTVTCTGSTK